ncbi:hypothetical protein BVC80_8257g5 [Macleaya cordata]|uniref:Uncharacterized protein n=1 Tax=Macleaya cordata TaxID=56857 RepID=A0A200Q453_MACCD|nr:hypothetical protein BVC80_8257g5 [Macleaya cordata]
MFHNCQLPTNKQPPKLQIRSSINNKVFEDHSRGIVCYKDENGEIICEGYDEGPRFHQQDSRKTCHQKELQILDILRRSWLQIAQEDGLNHAAENGVAAVEDFDWNGFRRYY